MRGSGAMVSNMAQVCIPGVLNLSGLETDMRGSGERMTNMARVCIPGLMEPNMWGSLIKARKMAGEDTHTRTIKTL